MPTYRILKEEPTPTGDRDPKAMRTNSRFARTSGKDSTFTGTMEEVEARMKALQAQDGICRSAEQTAP